MARFGFAHRAIGLRDTDSAKSGLSVKPSLTARSVRGLWFGCGG
jgi:hypothetical protein